MAKQKLLFLFFISSCTLADGGDIEVENILSSCITINEIKPLKDNVIPSVSVDITIDQSIGHCGCKSLLGSYNVYADQTDYRSHLIGGHLALKNTSIKYLPISVEKSLVNDQQLIIEISCALPD